VDGGGGAAFSMWLPVNVDSKTGQSSGSVARGSADLSGRRLLVVDDEAAVRSVLARCLEREGAAVSTAAGGLAALESIRKAPPEAMLLDLRMPDLDGLAVYLQIRDEYPDLAGRTIFISGDPSAMTSDLGVSRSRILTKPIELVEMRDAVRRVLQ